MDAAYLHELQRLEGGWEENYLYLQIRKTHGTEQQTLSGPDSEEEQLRDGKRRRWRSRIIGRKKSYKFQGDLRTRKKPHSLIL